MVPKYIPSCPGVPQWAHSGEKGEKKNGMEETKLGQKMGKEKLDDHVWQIFVGQTSKWDTLFLLIFY